MAKKTNRQLLRNKTRKEWRKKNRDKVKAQNQRYYRKNKEKIKAYSQEYRRENKEITRAWKEKNKEKIKAYQQEYRWLNREKLNAFRNEWAKRNRAKVNIYRRPWEIKNRVKNKAKNKKWKKDHPWINSYNGARGRCKKDSIYGKKGIRFFMALQDFKTLWFRDKAYNLKKPSIHRKDSKKNYVISNCKFIELRENQSEGGRKLKKKLLVRVKKKEQKQK